MKTILPVISIPDVVPVSILNTETSEIIQNVTIEDQYEPILFKAIIITTDSSSSDADAVGVTYKKEDDIVPTDEEVTVQQNSPIVTPIDEEVEDETPSDYNNENDYNITDEKFISRHERASTNEGSFLQKITPGAYLAGCAQGFYLFTIISFIINWFGATGRIGNILLNFR